MKPRQRSGSLAVTVIPRDPRSPPSSNTRGLPVAGSTETGKIARSKRERKSFWGPTHGEGRRRDDGIVGAGRVLQGVREGPSTRRCVFPSANAGGSDLIGSRHEEPGGPGRVGSRPIAVTVRPTRPGLFVLALRGGSSAGGRLRPRVSEPARPCRRRRAREARQALEVAPVCPAAGLASCCAFTSRATQRAWPSSTRARSGRGRGVPALGDHPAEALGGRAAGR